MLYFQPTPSHREQRSAPTALALRVGVEPDRSGEYREWLRVARLRPTRQRMALAWILFSKGNRHVTAEMLYEEAVKAKTPMSLGDDLQQSSSVHRSGPGAADRGRRRQDVLRYQHGRPPSFLPGGRARPGRHSGRGGVARAGAGATSRLRDHARRRGRAAAPQARSRALAHGPEKSPTFRMRWMPKIKGSRVARPIRIDRTQETRRLIRTAFAGLPRLERTIRFPSAVRFGLQARSARRLRALPCVRERCADGPFASCRLCSAARLLTPARRLANCRVGFATLSGFRQNPKRQKNSR